MSRQLLSILFTLFLAHACWAQHMTSSSERVPAYAALPNAPSLNIPKPRAIRSVSYDVARTVAIPSTSQSLNSLDGMRATLSLVSKVSSKLPSGSVFQARLQEPIIVNGQVLLPEGTIFEGRLQTVHARRMMRRGAVRMAFDRMILPDGSTHPVNLSVVSADSHAVTTDVEGKLRPNLSKKRLLIQVGGAGLAAKFSDDLAELVGGTAVGAGTARYFGLGASTAFLLLQHGPEVNLKPGYKFEVEFGRNEPPLPITLNSAGSSTLLSKAGN